MPRPGAVAWLLAAFLAASAHGARILNGPYVMLEDASRLRVRFEIDAPACEVVLLHGTEERTRVVPSFTRSEQDTFRGDVVVDLGLHRPFRGYEIVPTGGAAQTYDWRSQVNGELQGYPRLLVFSDSQGNPTTLARMAAQWRAESFDVLVALGDLSDTGSRYETWSEEFFRPLRGILPHYPLAPGCGNHDSTRGMNLVWHDWYFGRTDGKRYFRIDFGDMRLVGLNNSDLHAKHGFDPIEPLTPQYVFLLESLLGPSARDKKIVVLSHIPVFSASTVMNTEFGSELQRRYVLPIVERARVLGFIAGHHHKFERLLRPGLRGPAQYIVSGGGGGRLHAKSQQRGGYAMDREILGVHHYLTVDFSGSGTVTARTVDGQEIDRTTFGPTAAPPAAIAGEFWDASLAGDLSMRAITRIGRNLTLTGPVLSSPARPSAAVADLHRTDRGLVAMVRNGGAMAPLISFHGYDSVRKVWSYQPGGSLVIPTAGLYGEVALVALNGADLSPLDRIFPVLHWPMARARAGIDPGAGALLLLRGRRDFDLDPASERAIERWLWGQRRPEGIAIEQRQRQWSVMESGPPALQPRPSSVDAILRLIREIHPARPFLLQGPDGAILAKLVHWPNLGFVSVVVGPESKAGGPALFFPVDRPIQLAMMDEGDFALTIGDDRGATFSVPLGIVGTSP